ncbi:hypothetical protein [Chryseobacterium koreense]|uniref:Uncharacterized protein n=1 Tax=Chryseobacterium koreense CCUG 49689 TaxID=1304281 RepID=A0A0J7J097_9FLAO|nr:hypothetical protein [Chryseobacterium koreense]KMQ71491.1 hypothetical protein ACM44_06595 [Chryseobacterium koreense CCUG 49689]MBB5333758.1 NADH:ubiquinone oxidoreductase subunit 2 (subunit N) [Chryseobacterium koreense]
MEKKSPHILNASSNLLGFCLLIITSLKISKISGSTYVDDIAAVASLSLVVSCFLSFLAIRTENDVLEKKYEKYGDYLFLFALVCISCTVIFVSLNLIK